MTTTYLVSDSQLLMQSSWFTFITQEEVTIPTKWCGRQIGKMFECCNKSTVNKLPQTKNEAQASPPYCCSAKAVTYRCAGNKSTVGQHVNVIQEGKLLTALTRISKEAALSQRCIMGELNDNCIMADDTLIKPSNRYCTEC